MGLLWTKKPPAEGAKAKAFRIEMGWGGLFGLGVVCFCLFLWMFLLGLWAGQTILLPPRAERLPRPEAGGAPAAAPSSEEARPTAPGPRAPGP